MKELIKSEKLWGNICFNPKYHPKGRYKTYRELVFSRMVEVVKNICPVGREIITDSEWEKVIWDFLKNSAPKSPILRELPLEVAKYLQTHAHSLSKKYPYLGELIEYEYLEIQMRFAPDDVEKTTRGKIRINPAHVLATYRWPVHFISKEFHTTKKLPQGEYNLLLWRDPDSLEVLFMEVNHLVVSLIKILEKEPHKKDLLLKKIAKQHRISFNQEFAQEGMQLLEDLKTKKLLFS